MPKLIILLSMILAISLCYANNDCIPFSFEKNQGQLPPEVAYGIHGAEITFLKTGVIFGSDLFVSFKECLSSVTLEGNSLLSGSLHYYSSGETAGIENIPTYAQIIYQGLYQGIDLVYYGEPGKLESDYIVQPGATPETIQIVYEGAESLDLLENGDLLISLKNGSLVERAPISYQIINGTHTRVDSSFCLLDDYTVGFQVGEYDRQHELVIDPQIVFSSYLGGNAADDGNSIAVDTQGCTYVTGYTASTNFIRTIEIPTGTVYGSYVVKLAKNGSLIYATMIDGGNASAIAVDQNGCAYITGTTQATNLPVTPNAFQPQRSSVSMEAFVIKLNADGQLEYGTYLGGAGTDEGEAIAVDTTGHAYITGWTASTNFPVTPDAYQTTRSSLSDNFITKFTPDGTGIVYSTYANEGQPSGIAIDPEGRAYITGRTDGYIPDVHAIQPAYGGGTYDAYILKMNPTGSDISYATYYGGSSRDEGQDIEVDTMGNIYLTGWTYSSNIMVTNAYQPTFGGATDAFIAKLIPSGTSLVYATYLGTSNTEEGYGIAVNSSGSVFVAGITYASNFPVRNAIQPTKGWSDVISNFKTDAFITQFAADGSNIVYSTFWGGGRTDYCYDMALAPDGAVSIVGYTESTSDFPVYAAIQPTFAGGEKDAFMAQVPPIDIGNPKMDNSTIITNGVIAISWFGESGWRYTIEYTENLTPPSTWNSLPGFTNVLGIGTIMVATDNVSMISQRTYRVSAD